MGRRTRRCKASQEGSKEEVMSEVFHPCSLCNAHASFYKDPEQSIREAVALEIAELIVKTFVGENGKPIA